MDYNDVAFTMPIRLRRDLRAAGWHDRAIAAAVRSGALVRPRRGAYVDGALWRSLDSDGRHVVQARAVARRADTDVVISHASAVPWWRGPTWGLDLSEVHNTRCDGLTGRREAGIQQHSGVLLDGDVVECHGVKVASPTRAALEVTLTAPTEVGLVVLNDFLHRGLTEPRKVRDRYDATMEHWPSSRGTDLVIRLADPRISSVLESRFLYFCYLIGVPAPTPQYEVFAPDGRLVAVLDFAWPELGAYVETNGKAKYLELLKPGQRPGDVIERERRREEDVRRYTDWRALHVGWRDLETRAATERRVRAHLWPSVARVG